MEEKKKVLVVDDDIDVLDQVCSSLEVAGYSVSRAEREEEGEEVLMGMRPDVAVFDLMMERMDSGFVLCHRAKQLYPDLPVIILTGVASETGIGFEANAVDGQGWIKAERILDKPVRRETLIHEVERLLGR